MYTQNAYESWQRVSGRAVRGMARVKPVMLEAQSLRDVSRTVSSTERAGIGGIHPNFMQTWPYVTCIHGHMFNNLHLLVHIRTLARENGRFTWADGTYYEGEWKNGREEGHGTKVWPDKESYGGEWRGGLRHGQGRAVFSNKDTYVGDFSDGQVGVRHIYIHEQLCVDSAFVYVSVCVVCVLCLCSVVCTRTCIHVLALTPRHLLAQKYLLTGTKVLASGARRRIVHVGRRRGIRGPVRGWQAAWTRRQILARWRTILRRLV